MEGWGGGGGGGVGIVCNFSIFEHEELHYYLNAFYNFFILYIYIYRPCNNFLLLLIVPKQNTMYITTQIMYYLLLLLIRTNKNI